MIVHIISLLMKKRGVSIVSNHDNILDMREFVKQMLDDTAKTVDMVRQDIEKSIVDYNFLPGKYIIETDESVIVNIALPGIKRKTLT